MLLLPSPLLRRETCKMHKLNLLFDEGRGWSSGLTRSGLTTANSISIKRTGGFSVILLSKLAQARGPGRKQMYSERSASPASPRGALGHADHFGSGANNFRTKWINNKNKRGAQPVAGTSRLWDQCVATRHGAGSS